MQKNKKLFIRLQLQLILFLTLLTFLQVASAFEWEERSRDQFGTVFSYFIYPIAIDIPGLGTSSGLGASILNMNETDLDFTGFVLRGDFDVTGGTFLNYHIIKNRLLFDIGFYDFEAAIVRYDRGINSNKDSYILPRLNGKFIESQLTWTFYERHLEAFVKLGLGEQQVTQVLNNKDEQFDTIDSSVQDQVVTKLGFRFDNTNDRIDPIQGYRLETALNIPNNSDPFISDFVVADYNATLYLPFRKRDTLVFNLFRSDAYVTNQVDAEFDTLQKERGLDCDNSFPVDTPAWQACKTTEADALNQMLAANAHGTATSLGGTQRLRSFANGRYYAGHSMFWGVEYRWNLNDVRKPFDFYIAKGIRTGLQVAIFAEQGSVSERSSDLFDTLKTSYGVGFRIVLEGVILRIDYSDGSEGQEAVLFIDYPWSLTSIDS
ncbi:MAG: hypothetical protein ACC707_01535 [Thiohalomonadales bacterium]